MNKVGRFLFAGFTLMVLIIIFSLASSRPSGRSETKAAEHTPKTALER